MIPYRYFIHPEDEKAMNIMKSIPGFDKLVKHYMSNGIEEMVNGENLASMIRLSDRQLPDLYHRVTRICDRLGISDYPEVYLCMSPYPNAWTYGETKASITLTSALLDYLEEDEIDSVIAHECGHILCHHVLYSTLAHFLKLGAGGLFSGLAKPLRLAVKHWNRASELSADRVAIMVAGTDAFVRSELRLTGGPRSLTKDINIDMFIEQAKEYDKLLARGKGGNILQDIAVMENTHPFSAVRVMEGLKWARSKDFKTVGQLTQGKVCTCPHCHKTVKEEWKYCRHCGSKLN